MILSTQYSRIRTFLLGIYTICSKDLDSQERDISLYTGASLVHPNFFPEVLPIDMFFLKIFVLIRKLLK